MKDIDLLLTDEFISFSSEIRSIHEEKKTMKEEFKKIYERFQGDLAALDNRAAEASAKWEEWKKTNVVVEKKKEKQ